VWFVAQQLFTNGSGSFQHFGHPLALVVLSLTLMCFSTGPSHVTGIRSELTTAGVISDYLQTWLLPSTLSKFYLGRGAAGRFSAHSESPRVSFV
jgi:hypothetical protein